MYMGIHMDETILYWGFASKNLGKKKVGGSRGQNKIGQESLIVGASAARKGVIVLFCPLL